MVNSKFKNESIIKPFVLFLFIFLNYYNPFHVFLTICFNVALLIALSVNSNTKTSSQGVLLLYGSLILTIWVFFISLINSSMELYVLAKYFRVLISTFILYFIVNTYNRTPKDLNTTLFWIFSIHYLAVFFQVLDPSLSRTIGHIMGVTRENIFETFENRVMGLAGSFDTASLISISGILFFLVRYEHTNKYIYLFLSIMGALSAMQSSRTGMVISVLVMFLYVAHRSLKLQIRDTPKILFLVVVFILLAQKLVLPVLSYTFQIDILGTSASSANGEYGTSGTLDAMTHGHLLPLLNLNVFEFIFGVAYDPDATDNGYVKLIYHVGLVGTLLILSFYFYMLYSLIRMRHISLSRDIETIRLFLIFYIILVFCFNYKSLLLYSRGIHDLVILLFFFVTKFFRIEINKVKVL
jgi:hypothetical protein